MSVTGYNHPLSRWLQRALEILGAVFFLITLGSTLLGIAARYFQLDNVEWSFEVAALSFIWVTFIGCTLSEIHRENVSFTGFITLLPGKVQTVLAFVSNLVLLGTSGWLAVSGYLVLQRSAWVPTPVLRWPSGIIMFALFSAAIMLAIIALVRCTRQFRSPSQSVEAGS